VTWQKDSLKEPLLNNNSNLKSCQLKIRDHKIVPNELKIRDHKIVPNELKIRDHKIVPNACA